MVNLKTTLLVFSLLGLFNISIAQSPWAQPKKSGFAQLSLNFIPTYSQVFDADAELGFLESPREVSDVGIQVYTEYGLTDKTTLLFNMSFQNVRTSAVNPEATVGELEEASLSGLGNVNIGLKRQFLHESKIKLAGYITGSSRVSNWNEEAGLRRGYDAWLLNGGLSAGGSLNNMYGFLAAGVQLASANISHSFMSSFEVGTSVSKHITMALVINTRLSFRNIETDDSSTDLLTGLFTNNQETIAPGIKIFGTANSGWGISAAVFGAFYSDNYAQSPSVNVGVFKKW